MVFYSVFVFCIVGFVLFGDSFEFFIDVLGVNVIIVVLVIVGLLGFIVVIDIWYWILGRFFRLFFIIKIVVWGLFLFLLMGMLFFYFFDFDGGDGMDILLFVFF